MTLHRRGITRADILAALAERLEAAYRDAFRPALASPAPARERLRMALAAQCAVEEEFLEVSAALAARDSDALFHEPGDDALTRDVFVSPLRRILLDGRVDRSLRDLDAEETATVLFNLVGWTYHHLRAGHGWPPERATRAIVDVAVRGVGS
jgi:AcrR family transcriptional regulator